MISIILRLTTAPTPVAVGLLTERTFQRGVHSSVADRSPTFTPSARVTNAQPKPFRWVKSADDILAPVKHFCQRTLAQDGGEQPLS